MLTLVPLSIAVGIAMLWVFGRVSDQEAIRRTRNRLKAHIYELRLFADEPSLVWQAQKQLLAGNLRLVALSLRPAVVLVVPMVILFVLIEPFYGRKPLAVGEAAIVTVQMKHGLNLASVAPKFEAPDGVVIETPPVRMLRRDQVSLRIRALRPVSGLLQVILPGETLAKRLQAGNGLGYIADRRTGAFSMLLWHPGEWPFSSKAVDWIEVSYPPATLRWLGIDLHWLIWFLLISMTSALLLKRRLGVAL